MEDREKQFILRNLYVLIHVTKCNPDFRAFLLAQNVLSLQECQHLEAREREEGAISQASLLYQLLLTRRHAYDVLLRTLQRPEQQHQTLALNIISTGKKRNFDPTLEFDYRNDPVVRKLLPFISPPARLLDLLHNKGLPVLVITTKDITITAQRIHAERIPTEVHEFLSGAQLQEDFEKTLNDNVFMVAMHGKKRSALEVVLRTLKDIKTRVFRQSIVITSESLETVQLVLNQLEVSPDHFDVIEEDLKWHHLSEDFQTRLLEQRVKFQGQQQSLKELMMYCETEKEKKEVLEMLETPLLLKLINDEKPELCKNTLEGRRQPSFYVERKVVSRREEISGDILLQDKSPRDTVFAISGKMRHDLVALQAGEVGDAEAVIRGRNDISVKFILLKSDKQEQTKHFLALCRKIGNPQTTTSPVKNIHWLNYCQVKSTFEWVQSYGQPGSLAVIQQHVVSTLEQQGKYAVSEQQFLQDLGSKDCSKAAAICISDNPGMGKTTLMGHLGNQLLLQGQQTPTTGPRFVQYFIMTEIMRQLENQGVTEERNLTWAVIMEMLLPRMTKSSVVRHLFQKAGAHCDLLLDGFDEVLPHQAKLAVKFISVLRHESGGKVRPTVRLWLTTRPILLPVVEQTLGVLGYNMVPFDGENQKEFLKRYWIQEAKKRNIQLNPEKLEQFTTGSMKLMKRVSGNLSQFETEMTGLPLQCLLLGQICEGSVNFECSEKGEGEFHWEEEDPEVLAIKNLADLFGQALNKKLEIFLHRESSTSHLESHLSQNNKKVMTRIHMKLALELLFPEWVEPFEIVFLHETGITPEELSIYGFVTEYTPSNPVFVHRTYAEYFVALFAVEVGTNQRLLEGFKVVAPMARFLLDGVMATAPNTKEKWEVGEDLPQFQMSVVTYFIDELLENKMAEEPVPRPLLDAVGDNFEEAGETGVVDVKTSKLLASIILDRPHLCRMLLASLSEERKQQWLRNSREHHTKMVYLAALMTNKGGLETLCNLLEKFGGDEANSVGEMSYQLAKNPLLAAALVGKVESVEYLVHEKGFRPEVWAKPEMQILHHVVKGTTTVNERSIENRRNIIHFLAREQYSGAETPTGSGPRGGGILEHIDFLERTPLLAENVHIRLRMALLDAGANVQAFNQDGNQVLHMLGGFEGVTPENYQELLKLIEQSVLSTCQNPEEQGYIFQNTSGPNPNGHMYTPNWDWHTDTALHLAVGHLEVADETLEMFSKYGLNFNLENSHDCTIAHVAVKFGRSLTLVKKLITDYKVDWSIRDIAGMTAFHVAASVGYYQFLEWICDCDEYDFDIDEEDNNERTALHYAMLAPEEKRFETVKILVEKGADPNAINQEGDTPLTWSLYEGRGITVQLLEYLKGKGAYILGVGEDDQEKVLDAVYFVGSEEIDKQCDLGGVVEYLVKEGAKLGGGRCLGHAAAGNGWFKGLQLLDKYLGRDDFLVMALCANKEGYTVIGEAIRGAVKNSNGGRILKWLVSVIGPSVLNEMCGSGDLKPIHVCAKAGWMEGMELLVETYQVDVMARDEEGNTALHWAHCTEGLHTEMTGYLKDPAGIGEELTNEKGETPEEFGNRKADEERDYLSDFW